MKINLRQQILGIAAVVTLALGGAGTMAFTYQGLPVFPAQAAPQVQATGEEGDTTQDPSYTGSVPVDESQTDGLSETDEAAALQGAAKIDAAAAEAAALAANPGATVVKSTLDSENGSLVYSVQLSNGLDVKVDAGNGAILHTDQANDGEEGGEQDEASEGSEAGDTDNVQDETQDGEQDEAGDNDNVQDEQDGQPDDANEAPE
ncbi:MAG: PepSY domain-containing protein [Caldilineaceae bacterium]